MQRLDLSLHSHPKEFLGVESEPMLSAMKKYPLLDSSEQGQIRDATSGRIASPTHY